ncbi:hypothetical protein Tco_1496436, partial [Tanacetum coccineum]
AEHAKQVGDDVDLVDADDVDLLASLDLENIVTKLEEDFTRRHPQHPENLQNNLLILLQDPELLKDNLLPLPEDPELLLLKQALEVLDVYLRKSKP